MKIEKLQRAAFYTSPCKGEVDRRSEATGGRVGVASARAIIAQTPTRLALLADPGSGPGQALPLAGGGKTESVAPTGAATSNTNEIFAANRARGRIALAVRANAGATRRWRVREEGPLRVRCPGPPSAALDAVIVNTAGGVAGGDCFTIEVSVSSGARLVVTTAAAEKIYRSLGADATIDLKLKVGAGASLAWLPQETILFDGARLARRVDIELDEDAQLVLAEAIVFGRTGMGESIRDGRLSDRWQIRRQGQLIHAEALRLEGDIAAKLLQPAAANGASALATVLIFPANETTAARVRALGNYFHGEVAASAWKGMAVVRLCAGEGAALRHDLIAVLKNAGDVPLPRLWLN